MFALYILLLLDEFTVSGKSDQTFESDNGQFWSCHWLQVRFFKLIWNWWQANKDKLSATMSKFSTCRKHYTVSHVGSKTSPSIHSWGFPIISFTGSLSLSNTLLKRRNMYKKGVKEHVTTEYLLLSVVSFFQTWQSAGLVGLGTGKVSLSFCLPFLLFLSLSLSEPRPGSTWACSIVPQENCQSELYSDWTLKAGVL